MSTFGLIRGYRSSDATAQPLRLDKATNTIQIIDYAHHEIHAGSAYTCHWSQTAPTAVGEMTIIGFNTHATAPYVHMFAEFSSTAASTAAIYEAATVLDVDEGTTLAIYNRNRNSTNVSTVSTLVTSPVEGSASSFTVAQAAAANLVTTTPLYLKYLGAAAAGADTGGEHRDTHEFILKQGLQYAFVITSTTADDNTHNIILNWYEHTNIA